MDAKNRDLMTYAITNPVEYDLEVFPGWFLFGAMLPDGTVYQYVNDIDSVRGFLDWCDANGHTLVGFNSARYDDRVLTRVLETNDLSTAYETSADIIVNEVPAWEFNNVINSVDLMPVLPGRMSLKKIGVCLGHSRLQELPIPWDKPPTPEEQQVLFGYNRNDLEITRKLRLEIQGEIDLRARLSDQYGIDLRSKGEATLAEMILLHEYAARGGQFNKRQLNEQARARLDAEPFVRVVRPTWWSTLGRGRVGALGEELFQTAIPIVNERMSSEPIKRMLFVDDRYYQMGVGGLHSVDGPGAWVPTEDQILVDIDVASYYPNIIITQGLHPRVWGDEFLEIYRDIVSRRLHAKRTGDKTTADVLKIAANGTYGKSSDPYSALYDPQLTANVTVLGQLGLLVLIQMLEGVAKVVSANTDGITVLCDKAHEGAMRAVVSDWERATELEMEYTEYRGLYQRDVNNYIAVKVDGGVKQKGAFIDGWPDLRHTPSANIIATAVTKALLEGTPVRDTVRGCGDINQFILTQNVTGNTTTSWCGQPMGKVLRFYKSVLPEAAPIVRVEEGGKERNVPDSESCIPLENLPTELPPDIDYGWYVDKAEELLATVERRKRPGMNRWAEVMYRAGLRPCPVEPGKASRARFEYGTVDFTSLPRGWSIGTATGNGLIALRTEDATVISATSRDYPTRTRAKVKKDHGFELIYGARVPVDAPYYDVQGEVDWTEFYTPAELRKVK